VWLVAFCAGVNVKLKLIPLKYLKTFISRFVLGGEMKSIKTVATDHVYQKIYVTSYPFLI